MEPEAIVISVFFTVLILTLAGLSYFSSQMGYNSYGFCPETNPYNDKEYACQGRQKLNKKYENEKDRRFQSEERIRDYSKRAEELSEQREQLEENILRNEK